MAITIFLVLFKKCGYKHIEIQSQMMMKFINLKHFSQGLFWGEILVKISLKLALGKNFFIS